MIETVRRKASDNSTTDAPARTIGYMTTGTDTLAIAELSAISGTPIAAAGGAGVLFRQRIRTTKRGYNLFYHDVEYGRVNRNAGEFSWTWDGYGQPLHITTSLETVNSYGTSPPDFENLIGVRGDQVDGVDIDTTVSRFTIEFSHPEGFFTFAQAAAIDDIRGMVNSGFFFGFAAGEVRFIRFRGSDGTNAPAVVSYEFERQRNATGLTIGSISSIAKRGHDYAWIRTTDDVSSGLPVQVPEHVYVERVFEYTDLAAVLGFGV